MNDAARRPILYVLQPLAEVLQKLPIRDFDFPSRRHPHNKTGNTVYDQARIALARPQRFLRPLAFRNVLGERHEESRRPLAVWHAGNVVAYPYQTAVLPPILFLDLKLLPLS